MVDGYYYEDRHIKFYAAIYIRKNNTMQWSLQVAIHLYSNEICILMFIASGKQFSK